VKNLEIIPKEDDWILYTVAGCGSFVMSLLLLPLSLGVLMAALSVGQFKAAADLHGIRKWLALGISIALLVAWVSLLLLAQYYMPQLDVRKGRQNYLLGGGFLLLALWLALTLVSQRRKRKPLTDKPEGPALQAPSPTNHQQDT